jgi:subtilisin family serine protease
VWAVLNISGTGVVAANMDTGVDWQHPALRGSYRGYNPKGLPNHLYNWFDATNEQAQYPYDGYGHGTHTMGTLAGTGGIGVAPGARWIAARIFDSQGYAYDSWIHAGFQWILAPGGDPAQAPDAEQPWGSSEARLRSFNLMCAC